MSRLDLQTLEEWPLKPSQLRCTVARILLADDEANARELYGLLLRRAGFEVDLVCDGLEANKLLAEVRYDLLITDNMMPKLCGIDLLRKLKRENREVRAMMISGDMPFDEPDLKELVKHGGLLSKPFSAPRFLEMVEAALRGTPLPYRPFSRPEDLAEVNRPPPE